jgi:hypothetical protein
VGDINTKTIKRKAKTDPHAIKNFLPEEQEGEQEGEGCCGTRRGMCGTGKKRYEFTQVGGRRGKKGKSMVQAPPPPPPPAVKPKRKPMSQKEYCSLYRCY